MKPSQTLVFLNIAAIAYAEMIDQHIGDWLTSQIKRQRLSPLRFSGRHNEFDAQTLTTRELLDFNFEAECSGFVDLNMFEIKSLDDPNNITMVTGVGDDIDEEELVQRTIEKLLSIANRDKSVAFDNVFLNHDGMNTTYQRWARLAKYGGRIELKLDSVSDCLETEHHRSDRPDIIVQAVWRYKWNTTKSQSTIRRFQPSTHNIQRGPPPMSWGLRVQHAIVDGENGVITLEDDVNRRPPFMKAMAKYALHETLTRQGDLRQGQFGMSRIHDWGLDEPNDDPPYVGTRHFGEAPRMELPPPYSE